jgi:hypothetical protein
MTLRSPLLSRSVPSALWLLAVAPSLAAAQSPANGAVAPRPTALPGGFVENRGQHAPEVHFHGRQGAAHLWCTERGLVLGLPAATEATQDAAVVLEFRGAAPASIEAREPLPGSFHFLGQEGAVIAVPRSAQVLYRDLYPGVDLRLSQRGGQLEYDLEVAPGSGLEGVRLDLRGAHGARLLDGGRQVVHETPAGPLTQTIPAAWQIAADGSRQSLEGRFTLGADGSLGFELPGRDPSLPAVLDPVLGFAGYLGGAHCDIAHDVALDTLHRSFVVGVSQSATFPTTPGVIDTTWLNDEGFLASFDEDGSTLRFATFFGGSGDDYARALDVNSTGTLIWVGGETESADFPVTPGAFQTTKGDFEDGFLARISADGTALDWASFAGGDDSDWVDAIDIDPQGRVYSVGSTASTDFPVSPGAFQPNLGGGFDAFFLKLGTGGAALFAATYVGGASDDFGTGLAFTVTTEVILGGTTRSNDFPTTPGSFQPARAGGEDGFVVRLSGSAGALLFGTYLGGAGDDRLRDLAIWPAQTVYVVGITESSDYPVTPGALFPAPLGLDDGFLSVVSVDGSALVHSTYFGGSGHDQVDALALDPVGTTFLVGSTSSPDLPVTGDAFQPLPGGGLDQFHANVSSDGSALDFCTYWGGPADDFGHGIDHDDFTGEVCFVGHVLDGAPSTPGSFDPSFNGGSGDGSIACYLPVPCPTAAAAMVLGTPCDTATLTVPPLVQGTYIQLGITTAPPAAPGVLYTSPVGAVPFLFEGTCTVWIDVFTATPFTSFVTDAGGSWTSPLLGLPNDAPRCAKQVTFQAIVLDPVGGPLSVGQLTNGVECTFGS